MYFAVDVCVRDDLPCLIYCNVRLFCLLVPALIRVEKERTGADKGHFLIHTQSVGNTVGQYKSVRDGRRGGVSCC